MAKLPKTIKIGPLDWEVTEREDVAYASGTMGSTHMLTQTINIRPGMKPQAQWSTLCHEVMHAAMWVSGMDGQMTKDSCPTDEELVNALSMVMFQVLRDNPSLTWR